MCANEKFVAWGQLFFYPLPRRAKSKLWVNRRNPAVPRTIESGPTCLYRNGKPRLLEWFLDEVFRIGNFSFFFLVSKLCLCLSERGLPYWRVNSVSYFVSQWEPLIRLGLATFLCDTKLLTLVGVRGFFDIFEISKIEMRVRQTPQDLLWSGNF